MKKLLMPVFVLVTLIAAASLAAAGVLPATPLPAGAKVTVSISGNQALITVTGVSVTDFEYYSYSGVQHLKAINGAYEVDLSEGRRFNFTFPVNKDVAYVYLTPEMKGRPQSFMGPFLDVDDSWKDKSGTPRCCFIILNP